MLTDSNLERNESIKKLRYRKYHSLNSNLIIMSNDQRWNPIVTVVLVLLVSYRFDSLPRESYHILNTK